MTDENSRQNVADELARAEQALQAARALVGLGLHADSVSRAYYACFHLLRGLLYSHGVEAKPHVGAIHVFNTEFVRAGLFATSHNRLLAGMQRSRELADYDAAVVFAQDDAEAHLAEAGTFRADVVAHLGREGWLGDPSPP